MYTVYMHVYVWISMYMYSVVYIYVHIYSYIIYMSTCIDICIYKHMHTSICIYIFVCICVYYIYVYIQCAHVCIYIWICMYISGEIRMHLCDTKILCVYSYVHMRYTSVQLEPAWFNNYSTRQAWASLYKLAGSKICWTNLNQVGSNSLWPGQLV